MLQKSLLNLIDIEALELMVIIDIDQTCLKDDSIAFKEKLVIKISRM